MADEQSAGWTMREWMEPYREYFTNTGGNSVEDLMRDEDTTMFNNAVRALLIASVRAQVGLLYGLHRAGLLKETEDG